MAAVQMSRPRLTLVTHQTWRAEDLAPWADVHLDFGLDTAAGADAEAMLWCPGGWAAAATVRHRHLQLSSAGPRWLDYLPIELKGREVVTSHAGALRQTPPVIYGGTVFAKLPETKHDSFPAQLRPLDELLTDLSRLPDREPVQLQTPVHFDSEVRCWCVTAESSHEPATFQAGHGRTGWISMIRCEQRRQSCGWKRHW